MNRKFAAPLLVLLSGCVALETNPFRPDAPPAPGTPCQVVTTWQPQVYYTPDPTHNGVQSPTLAGRVYLFGPEVGFPMTGDGSLVVDLYEGAVPPGSTAAPLEEWRFDPATLHRLLKRDAVGWGYTVPLPWTTYRADVKRVQFKVRYEPAHGTPLYSESASMAIDSPGAAPVVTESAKPHGS